MKKLVFMHACEFEPSNIGAIGSSVPCYQSNVEVFPTASYVVYFFFVVACLVYYMNLYFSYVIFIYAVNPVAIIFC